ncbi:MAG: saccharopine dehydrogenase [Pseudomonadota bacterium]
MTHLWVRAEHRAHEARVGVTPEGVAALVRAGLRVTVERSAQRIIGVEAFAEAGAEIAPEGSWPDARQEAVIFGLKELPKADTALKHTHIMFGHAFKGQSDGIALLRRLKAGGGALLDLEYLVDEAGRRVAAFGYWAGYAGAAVALKCWAAQREGRQAGPVAAYDSSTHLLADLQTELLGGGTHRPTALIIGAKGRVGTGAADLCTAMGVATTRWDMEETQNGGPFPQVLAHDLFFNCVVARPGTPVFVPRGAGAMPRRLSVIGDIACDPGSDFNPVPVYDRETSWDAPALRVHDTPPLDVTAIDNLPSLLPLESSEDFAAQLLPHLAALGGDETGVWARARATYETHAARL